MVAARFSGDPSFADLVVSATGEAPGSDPTSGWVYAFRGSTAGLENWTSRGQAGMGANELGDDFGSALAAGDFDRDGLIDLVVGAPGEKPGPDPRAGAFFAFRGGSLAAWRGFNQEDPR